MTTVTFALLWTDQSVPLFYIRRFSKNWQRRAQRRTFSLTSNRSYGSRVLQKGRSSVSCSCTDYITQVCSRSPSLTNLDLCLEEHMGNFEDYVLVLLRGLPHLQRVSVPIYALTPRLLTELSRLKHIAIINLTHPARAEPGNRADVAHFSPTLANNAFPALRSLSFSAQVEHAAQLLRDSLFPAQLTELHLKAIMIATPDALQDLFSAIRDRCTSLVQLSVDYIIAPDSQLTSPPPPLHERPTIATFRPLFSARHIRAFEFRWDYALAISDDDMEEFASSWPSLESLHLNPEPVPEPNVPGLNLRVLLPFARYCPNLRHLGLHVDARTIPDLAPTPRSQRMPRFRRLETLAVGLSAIAKSEPVTLFLSQILPLGCSIGFGLRWPDAFDIAMEHALVPVSVRAEMSTNHVRWNEVSRMLPIATKARMEEKARIEALERQMMELELSRREDKKRLSWLEQEVQDLRGRTGRTP
ncbi:hypothetical protein L226DRAFT_540367 [Lentinus tigrinus ALCF2SS1-7]|uniref:uncharacterized protein n=1 Tax=Lentinus tigrinus ALCF2SS1-7 TaxID=1328758 RepID=UPI00116637E7|nr:hypothetical protein L226DRAFT_540367 [Lentinus tigrinus ALCF2SS1-7]